MPIRKRSTDGRSGRERRDREAYVGRKPRRRRSHGTRGPAPAISKQFAAALLAARRRSVRGSAGPHADIMPGGMRLRRADAARIAQTRARFASGLARPASARRIGGGGGRRHGRRRGGRSRRSRSRSRSRGGRRSRGRRRSCRRRGGGRFGLGRRRRLLFRLCECEWGGDRERERHEPRASEAWSHRRFSVDLSLNKRRRNAPAPLSELHTNTPPLPSNMP